MTPIEDVLRTWREAERLLDDLPLDPDHESVALAITRLKDCYQALTDPNGHSADVVASAKVQLEDAHALLSSVKGKQPAGVLLLDEPALG